MDSQNSSNLIVLSAIALHMVILVLHYNHLCSPSLIVHLQSAGSWHTVLQVVIKICNNCEVWEVWEEQQTQIVKTIYLCDNAQSAVRLELAQIDCVSSFTFLLQKSSCKNQTPHAESTQMLCPSKARALEGSKFLIPKHWGKIFLQTKTPESSSNSSLERWEDKFASQQRESASLEYQILC